MKKLTLIVLSLFCLLGANAQSDFIDRKPISISYLGHYGFHPGLKIGTQYDWLTWEKRKEKTKKTKLKHKSLFVSPQLGYYFHAGNHTSLLVNADFGYQRIKQGRGFYSAWSIGLGYITQFNAGITYEENNHGYIEEKKWASKGYFMPTFNYEFGQQVNTKIGWFGKLSAGSKLAYNTGVSAETFIELGVKLNLGNF